MDWSSPSADDQVAFFSRVEEFYNKEGDLDGIPDLFVNGVFDKKLFAGILLFEAPRSLLFGEKKSRRFLIF